MKVWFRGGVTAAVVAAGLAGALWIGDGGSTAVAQGGGGPAGPAELMEGAWEGSAVVRQGSDEVPAGTEVTVEGDFSSLQGGASMMFTGSADITLESPAGTARIQNDPPSESFSGAGMIDNQMNVTLQLESEEEVEPAPVLGGAGSALFLSPIRRLVTVIGRLIPPTIRRNVLPQPSPRDRLAVRSIVMTAKRINSPVVKLLLRAGLGTFRRG